MKQYVTIGIIFSIVVLAGIFSASYYFVYVLAQEQQMLQEQKHFDLFDKPVTLQPIDVSQDKEVEVYGALPLSDDRTEIIETDSSQDSVPDNIPEKTVTENLKNSGLLVYDVPFTPQAPFADWDDPRQDYGCEEASLLMAMHWVLDEPINREQALLEITELSDWQLKRYDNYHDTSAADTLKLLHEYFEYFDASLHYDIGITDIKNALQGGSVVVVPLDGRILDNPYYTPPGPLHHMLVVIGYDDATGEFITNDPGTSRGEGLRYTYENFYDAMRDYDTGHGEPVERDQTAMIVIHK